MHSHRFRPPAVVGLALLSIVIFSPSIVTVWAAEPAALAKVIHESPTVAQQPDTNVTAIAPKLTAALPHTENLHAEPPRKPEQQEEYENQLQLGKNLRQQKDWEHAEKVLAKLLQGAAPLAMKRDVLIELGLLAEETQNFTRAQQVYAQFLKMFPDDLVVPEIYLRQGLIYRQMGAPNLALGKFYAVMSMALNLKQDHLEHYQRLVLRAQTEIADTYYLRGSYQDAVDFFNRLLKLNDAALNNPQIAAKLIRTLSALQRNEETVGQANLYLEMYGDSAEGPEVRFLLADALRKLGRNNEATMQVMALLADQQAHAEKQPEIWRYWQQRTGNEIANQLYKNGDYLNALEIYTRLTQLDASPVWLAPLHYQIGLASEKLEQSAKAAAAYQQVLDVSSALGTNATPAIKLVVDMSRWRLNRIEWAAKSSVQSANLTTNAQATATSPVKQ
ncbi:MAG: tetratricopeptide repeat protein [Verrucomicrobiota bacterium]